MNENDICQNRHKGNVNSIRVNPSPKFKERDRVRVYEVIQHNEKHWPGEGSTSKEIASKMNRRLNCISGRISELKQAGLVVSEGRRNGCGIIRLTQKNYEHRNLTN